MLGNHHCPRCGTPTGCVKGPCPKCQKKEQDRLDELKDLIKESQPLEEMAEAQRKKEVDVMIEAVCGEPRHPRPLVGIGVFVENDFGQILLGLRKGEHGGGKWGLPGGHLEHNETFRRVCQREVFEETGIIILTESEPYKVGFVNSKFEESGKHYVTLFFHTKMEGGSLANREPDRCEEWRWFHRNELPKSDEMFEPLADIIKQLPYLSTPPSEKNLTMDQKIERGLNAAIYIQLSPHEWEWTQTQQEDMAIALHEQARLIDLIRKESQGFRKSMDNAYKERNRLVAFLSKIFPSHLCKHTPEDETWEDDWRWIVCIHSPQGQLTWHIHDTDYPLFKHLEEKEGHWDGHTTEEKYERLDKVNWFEFGDKFSDAVLKTIIDNGLEIPVENLAYIKGVITGQFGKMTVEE